MTISTDVYSAFMRRLILSAVVAVQITVLAAVGPLSAGAHDQSCPSGHKVCIVNGEPPAPGVYKFKPGSSGPDINLPGRLSVSKTAAGYAVSDFRMHLGQKQGCGLNGQLATVEAVFPLTKRVKYFPLGEGQAEASLSWRLPNQKVKVKVGGQVYPGDLLAAFLTPPTGEQPSVEGHLTLTPQAEAVCGGDFLGTHVGKL